MRRQELLRKAQAVRIENIRQEKFLWQSTATWEQLRGAEEGTIESIPGNEGRIAHACLNVTGGLRIFSVYFWHSEECSSRNEALLEAVMKRTRNHKASMADSV